MVPHETKKMLSEEEYLISLILLRKYKEFDLVDRCLSLNEKVHFSIDIELERWLRSPDCSINNFKPKKHFKKEVLDYLKETVEYLEKEPNSEDNVSEEEYIDRYSLSIMPVPYTERKTTTVFEYKKALDLHAGDTFGDRALNSISKLRYS